MFSERYCSDSEIKPELFPEDIFRKPIYICPTTGQVKNIKEDPMRFKRSTALITALFMTLILVLPVNSPAITIAEEEELSREFLKVIDKRFNLIKDPYIVKYVNSVGQKILSALPPQPFPYRFYVIKADVYNAFATPAGHIFIYSGLLEAMESEDELAGILAHEIAHVQCRHISDNIERSSKLNLAALAGIIAGAFLGASGASAAANALTIGSTAAVHTLQLAFSREDELQADQIGLENLKNSGYNAEGLLTMLKKIREKRWFGPEQIPTYMTTHPAAEDRISYIDGWLETHGHPESTEDPGEFKKARMRLLALFGDETKALQHFKNELNKQPDDAMAHYGYGLALGRAGHRTEAAEHLKIALNKNPLDPYLLKELGRLYFRDGKLPEALTVLQGSINLSNEDPESLFILGRIQMELGRLEEAADSFEMVIANHREYPDAYYFLGEAYGKLGRLEDAHYFLGIYAEKNRDYRNAIFHLEKALQSTSDPNRREEIEKRLKTLRKDFADERREIRMKQQFVRDRNFRY